MLSKPFATGTSNNLPTVI